MTEDINGTIESIIDRFPPGGELAESDRAYLRDKLRRREGPLDAIIYTLGRAGNPHDRDLIREFVTYSGDAYLPARALRTLCFWIDRWRPYANHIIQGVKGEPWDGGGAHKLACIRIASEILIDQYEQRLVDLIIQEFHRTTDISTKRSCFEALRNADGRSAKEAFLETARDRNVFDLSLLQRLAVGNHHRSTH